MDYRYLKQQLMKTFQQLVIFDIKEVKLCETLPHREKAIKYDLTDQNNKQIMRKYYMGSYNYTPLIVTLEDRPTNDPFTDSVVTIYNLYNAIVKHQTHMVFKDEMDNLVEELTDSDRQIHWVWFREREFCLPDKIMSRAKSWIQLNPTFKFYLWTNLIDHEELMEFISNLSESNKQYFIDGKIIVRYQDDTYMAIEEFCQRFGSYLDQDAIDIIKHLYDVKQPLTNAITSTFSSATHTTVTTTITTETQNNYKINRIFRVDMLRVIILCLFGGIYSDFNDTICFYPMKYLLTLYRDEYFMGTDYDIDHPIYRNNYFIYSPLDNKGFIDLSLKCINKATKEYMRITSTDYMKQYYDVCLEFLTQLNLKSQLSTSDVFMIPILIQLDSFKKIISDDKYKECSRVINMIAELCDYFGGEIPMLKNVHQRLSQELESVDLNLLRTYQIKRKMNRRRRHTLTEFMLPVIYDQGKMQKMTESFEYYDNFLMKYAVYMTIGDLILSTNISYICDEIKNLIPYSRSNRLSTISMITHVYDGTSYGLARTYDAIDPSINDLRREFL